MKELLMGTPAEQVFKLDVMANADCVPWFVAFAQRQLAVGHFDAARCGRAPCSVHGVIPPSRYSTQRPDPEVTLP